MAGTINKGIILSIEQNGTRARVRSSAAEALVSRLVTIPWHLRGATGNLKKGTEVVYVIFEDQTGILFSRMDGEWGHVIAGDITATGDVKAGTISLKTHTHGGVETGSGSTSGPK